MSTLNATDQLTYMELVKRSGVNADQRRIIEVLATTNEMLLDAPMVEANDGAVNTQLVRTTLPHGTHRAINQGVSSAASQTKTVHDYICQVSAFSNVDLTLVKRAPNPAEFLTGEAAAFIAGMGEDQATDIFYGDHSSDPAYMDGFATRRASIDNTLCIDMGGTGSNLTSVYLVKWGPTNVKYIYPRGAAGLGVNREDRGVQTAYDANNKPFLVHQDYFDCQYGMAVGNEKALIRLANIDVTASGIGETLIKKILAVKSTLPKGDGTISILGNSSVVSLFDVATMEKNNVVYTAEDAWGRELTKIRDMRIRQCDAILSTESAIS